jgi:Asp/Glu/hydantoin racemase
MEMAWTKTMEMLHMLVRKLEEPKEAFKKAWRQLQQEKKASVVCRGCGEVGHLRNQCKQPTGKTTPMSENASRPQA